MSLEQEGHRNTLANFIDWTRVLVDQEGVATAPDGTSWSLPIKNPYDSRYSHIWPSNYLVHFPVVAAELRLVAQHGRQERWANWLHQDHPGYTVAFVIQRPEGAFNIYRPGSVNLQLQPEDPIYYKIQVAVRKHMACSEGFTAQSNRGVFQVYRSQEMKSAVLEGLLHAISLPPEDLTIQYNPDL